MTTGSDESRKILWAPKTKVIKLIADKELLKVKQFSNNSLFSSNFLNNSRIRQQNDKLVDMNNSNNLSGKWIKFINDSQSKLYIKKDNNSILNTLISLKNNRINYDIKKKLR